MDKVKRYIPYLLLTGLTLFFCRIFVGRYGIFGAKVDWLIVDFINQCLLYCLHINSN